MKRKPKINLKEYVPIDRLDDEEQKMWESMRADDVYSILTEENKAYYANIVENCSKRDQASTIRLTLNDKLLAKTRAKEEGMPYQVLLASIIHKWLHGKLVDAA